MKSGICGMFVVALVAAGCGSSESMPTGEPQDESRTAATDASTTAVTESTPPETSDAPPLIGRWKRVNRCPQLLRALDQVGLRAIAPSVVGDYFPAENPMRLAEKDNPCEGAEPIVHYHFFDVAGAFGSLDENEDPVDDGSYEIIDDGRFRIGNSDFGVVFRYEIEGDTLSLAPVLTPAMKDEALAHPLQFSDAGWAVSVSYPGHEWKRVDCGGWC